jgi:two-component system sensor histidine kinase/response regulator
MLNLATAEANCCGDPTLIVELAEIMISELPLCITNLETALREQSGRGIATAAHKLRGSLALIGAEDALSAAGKLERLANTGDLTAVAGSLGELEVTLTTVAQDLRLLMRDGVDSLVRG